MKTIGQEAAMRISKQLHKVHGIRLGQTVTDDIHQVIDTVITERVVKRVAEDFEERKTQDAG